jgi:hypothetical protein
LIVVLVHIAGLALTIFTIIKSGDRPQVLFYAFISIGYNTREVTVLAFATLTAGLVVVIRQAKGFSSSGWVVLGPLLAFRFLLDLSSALRSRAR